MASKCKPKLSDRCLNPMNAVCVDYDGILLETTTLDPDDCNTVEDVIEDVINQVDENTSDLDFTEFESCLEIEASDEDRGVTIKDVISVHDTEICDLKEQLENLRNPDETECETGCCEEENDCCSILKKYDSVIGEVESKADAWEDTTQDALMYKALKMGTYKFTFEFGINSAMLTTQTTFAGISMNGFDPGANAFEQTLITTYNSNTVVFIKKLLVNDVVRLSLKRNGSTYIFDAIKMIVEKVK